MRMSSERLITCGKRARACMACRSGWRCRRRWSKANRATALYAELKLAAGNSLLIPAEHRERALYLIAGEAQLEGNDLPRYSLAVLPEGEELLLSACGECHLALIGGEPLGPRRMYWNFVASDAALLEKAKQDWAALNWPRVPGETARIELPARTS